MERTYLDCNATTPLNTRVQDQMLRVLPRWRRLRAPNELEERRA